MRIALPSIILVLATGAAAEPPATTPPQVVIPMPPQVLSSPPGISGDRVPCRDTIHEVREARGLAGEASVPQPGQLIAAVDHRISGCAVMVMYRNTSDVRPLPALPDGAPQLRRIPGG